MQEIHVIDLNLLSALEALLAERSVTRAAVRVGLTQPAMSHALARLRKTLGDPLFVRTSAGLVPTPRCERLAEPLERILREVARMVEPPAAFDPKTSRRKFRVATTDYVELVLLPRLFARLREEAPNVNLQFVAVPSNAGSALIEERVDVVIGLHGSFEEGAGFRTQKLFDDSFVCVVREGHPKKKLTLEAFVELPHLLISPRGASGSIVDDALAKLGLRRRVALDLPHFLVAPHVIKESDLVLTLAGRVANVLVPVLGLRQLAPPIELATFAMAMLWHERAHADEAHVWLRRMISETARRL